MQTLLVPDFEQLLRVMRVVSRGHLICLALFQFQPMSSVVVDGAFGKNGRRLCVCISRGSEIVPFFLRNDDRQHATCVNSFVAENSLTRPTLDVCTFSSFIIG